MEQLRGCHRLSSVFLSARAPRASSDVEATCRAKIHRKRFQKVGAPRDLAQMQYMQKNSALQTKTTKITVAINVQSG